MSGKRKERPMINRKMAKIREKFLWTSLYIEIAWLRFKISKLATN